MKLNDVLTLINAGYTKAEIDALEAAAQPSPTAAGAPDPGAPVEPETPDPDVSAPAEPAAPETTQNAGEQPALDRYKILEDKLNKLIGMTAAGNINADIGAAAPQRTTTDILGGVIAPPRKEIKSK